MICAEAGLTVDAAFNRVAKELGRAYPELGDEFALTAIELSFLNERKVAFDNLAYRVDLEAVKGVVTTMVQTERYGTPLASALRVLSAEFRNERMMRAEEKAARLPAIMTVPLIMFILPVLFIVILGPAACSIADAFSGGIGQTARAAADAMARESLPVRRRPGFPRRNRRPGRARGRACQQAGAFLFAQDREQLAFDLERQRHDTRVDRAPFRRSVRAGATDRRWHWAIAAPARALPAACMPGSPVPCPSASAATAGAASAVRDHPAPP